MSSLVCRAAIRGVISAAVLSLYLGTSAIAFAQDTSSTNSSSRNSSDLSVILFDGFNGKLGLNWKPVRYDPTHVSLSGRQGMLTIRTQRGTIHRDEKAQGWVQAKNLYLIENPLPKEADFQITTALHRFRPIDLFQQAGLLLYNDDDNYLKWIVQFNRNAGVGQLYSLLSETQAASEFRHYPAPDDAADLWLRITKRGTKYAVAGSVDGTDFQVVEEREWPVEGPTKIGLVAKNGGGLQDAPEMDAHFEFFELRSPPADKSP